jgi:hypothetical protein
MRRPKAAFALALSITTAGVTNLGCGPPFGSTTKDCAMSVESPHVSKGAQTRGNLWIIAKIRVQCDHPPQAHHVWVRLEHNVDNVWKASATVQPDDADRVPKPGSTETYYATYQGCESGTWRATGIASGISASGVPFDFKDNRTGTITKQKCGR